MNEREKLTQQIKDALNEAETTKRVNDILDALHPSDAHMVIRDMFTPKINRMITNSRGHADKAEADEYQRFQGIKIDAKKAFDHDRTTPTMLDVDKAITKVYGIIVRMIKATNDTSDVKFNKVYEAINKIEKHLGIDVTDFRKVDEDDTTEHNDVQGIKENTDGVRESGE